MKKSNFNKNFIIGLKTFIIITIIFIFTLKFFGFPDRYDFILAEPMSWNEIYETMDLNFTIIIALTIYFTVVFIQLKKNR